MADGHNEGFLNRWARRKQRAVRTPSPAPDAPAQAPDTSEAEETNKAERAEAEARRQELIDSLPEPEQLGPEDDYTQFLQDGVPDELRQRALRRLWTSNPVFANLDGLNDYDLDYTDAATVVENLKTAFQAGRGMVTKEEREAEAAAAERAARGEPEPTPGAREDADPDDADPEHANPEHANPWPGEGDPDGAAEAQPEPDADAPADAADSDAQSARARYRQTPDGRVRVKGSAAQRRWGG